MQNRDAIKQVVGHVLWIGGGTDAGKSSVAQLLAEKYNLPLYSFDEHAEVLWENHFSHQPSSHGYGWMAMTLEERWVLRSPEAMALQAVQIAEECFPLVLEFLQTMSQNALVVAEGFEFLPLLVDGVITTKRQAIWLLPTQGFQAASFTRRNKPVYHQQRSDPVRAAENHLRRDLLLTQWVKEQADGRGLATLEIDGALALDAVASLSGDGLQRDLDR